MAFPSARVASLADHTPELSGKTKGMAIKQAMGGSATLSTDGLVYILYNKPAGVECTTDRRVPGNVVDAVGHSDRIFPGIHLSAEKCFYKRTHPQLVLLLASTVGRLDKDTTGLLLLTSDGRLPNACLRAERGLAKTYEVCSHSEALYYLGVIAEKSFHSYCSCAAASLIKAGDDSWLLS